MGLLVTLELLLVLGTLAWALRALGRALVRYVPALRTSWRFWAGRVVEQQRQYLCERHGRLDPVTQTVLDADGLIVCKQCYGSHLVTRVTPLSYEKPRAD
jgi:hypothetical protein